MTNRVKLAAAGVGTAAVLAMGALGVAFTVPNDGAQSVGEGPEITLGETTTSTTAQTEIPTPFATPEVTADPG